MEKTKVLQLLIGLILIFLVWLLVFLGTSFFNGMTGRAISEYSYTKAVCNSTNYCEDYEIVCDGKEVISMTFTGFSIQNPSDWVDPRSKEIVENTC
jgi:hypothetical protein|tara:strand:- start:1242 stop:1529 length:288 start_codon:yes stop_codon:yes gene_type:complete